MATGSLDYGSYKNITGSSNIQAQEGLLLGFFVATTTAGTLAFYDSTTTTTTVPITGTITPNAGAFYPLPLTYLNGLYVVVGGTINATIVFAA